MKKCPFCAEEIQDEATVCKHCGRSLSAKRKDRWNAIIGLGIGLLVVGILFQLFITPTTYAYVVQARWLFDNATWFMVAGCGIAVIGLVAKFATR